MNEDDETKEYLLTTTFSDLNIGEVFDFLSEGWTKTTLLRATRISDGLDWIFPQSTEVNQ